MAGITKMTYGVDMVFCIDATRSMDHIIDTVKNNALNLYSDIMRTMEQKKKYVTQLRVRVVAFRDYLYDKEKAMLVTDFFYLPQQAEEFRDCVSSIIPEGGGDDPEDGLEALAYAMKSDWDKQSIKRRHVIVVWSDAPTHVIGFGKKAANYPKGMPGDFDALSDWWGTPEYPGVMDENAKRLLLFAPDKESWNKISANWSNVTHYVSQTGGVGLSDVDYQQILSAICNSI